MIMDQRHEVLLEAYLGPLEQRIMTDVWDNGPSTVNDVLERLNESGRRSLVYNTVMSTLARLAQKRFLDRHREGRAYVYEGDGPELFLRRQAAETTRELLRDLGEVAIAGVADGFADDDVARRRLLELLAGDA
jgi:predicted transcriptional regulator